MDFLEWGTINSAHCVETLKKLKTRIAQVGPGKKEKILLQHNSARPHPDKGDHCGIRVDCPATPAIQSLPCIIRLSPVLFDEGWPLWEALH